MSYWVGNAKVVTISIKEIEHVLSKNKPEPPPSLLCRITSKTTALRQQLVYRYDCRYRPLRFFSLESLPDDVVYMLLEYLSLADTACLALVSKRFYLSLQKYARRINDEDGELSFYYHGHLCQPCGRQKFEFLQRIEPQLRDWYLCKFCYKYYAWGRSKKSKHDCRRPVSCHDRGDLGSSGNICFSSYHRLTYEDVQLVMRAKHYKSNKYGLPIETLNRTVLDGQGWTTTTTAAFDWGGNLIVRIVAEPHDIYPDRYSELNKNRQPVPRARCCEKYSQPEGTSTSLETDCRALHCHRGNNGAGLWYLNPWISPYDRRKDKYNRCACNAWNPGYHECDGCGAVYGVTVSCKISRYAWSPGKSLFTGEHNAKVVFYRNLGHMSTYNDIPKTTKLCAQGTSVRKVHGERDVAIDTYESNQAAVWRMEALFAGM